MSFQLEVSMATEDLNVPCDLQACANDAIDTVLDGCNATILAYGQTGAGKTYTMTGVTASAVISCRSDAGQ